MPHAAPAAVWAFVLGLASTSLAQTNGYVGIYADAAGTTPCLNVRPSTAGVLYVIATCEGLTAGGITGAEFRIEVTNPSGWWLSYNAPIPSTVLGNPIDSSSDSGDVSGVNIGFASCQVPTNAKVGLGTISVYNAGGSATNLLVKQHSAPRHPEYFCAQFTRCDDPTFSKNCMTEVAAATCSTLTKPSTPVIRSSDEPVFSLLVNGIPAPAAVGQPFSYVLPLRSSVLYVNGRQVEGPEAECVFDGSRLTIGGVEVDLQVNEPTPSEAQLTSVYGTVPSVTARTSSGLPLAAAVEVFVAERLAIERQAAQLVDMNNYIEARAILESSPLVESVAVNQAYKTVRIKYRGMSSDSAIEPHYFRGTPEVMAPKGRDMGAVAQKYATSIREGLHSGTPGGMLIILWGGVVSKYSGPALRDQAQAQIDHILAGGSVATAPPGPLTAGQLQGFTETGVTDKHYPVKR